jgi:hypothetical protein
MAYVDEGAPEQPVVDPLTEPQGAVDFRSALVNSPAAQLGKTLRDAAPAVRSIIDQVAPEIPPLDPKVETKLRMSMIFGSLAGQRPEQTAAFQVLSRENARREQNRVQRNSIAKQFIVEQLKGVGAGMRQIAGDQTKEKIAAGKIAADATKLQTLEEGRMSRAKLRAGRLSGPEILAGMGTPEQRKALIDADIAMATHKAQAQAGAAGSKLGEAAYYRQRTTELGILERQAQDYEEFISELDALIASGQTKYADKNTFEERDAVQSRLAAANALEAIAKRKEKLGAEIEKGPGGSKGTSTAPKSAPPAAAPESAALTSALQKERQNLPASAYTPEEAQALLAHRKALRAGQ